MADNITPLRIVILARQSLFLDGIAAKLNNYPGDIDVSYVVSTSPKMICELKSISPAIILIDAGDSAASQLSIPSILDIVPNSKVYRFNLSSDQISIFTSKSVHVNCVNELVEFMQTTSVVDTLSA